MLDEKNNNYLMSIYKNNYMYGIAVADISTGDFSVTEITWGNTKSKLIDEIGKYSPSEIITNDEMYKETDLIKSLREKLGIYISMSDPLAFDLEKSLINLKNQFEDIDNIEDNSFAACAAGALLKYINETQKIALNHIKNLKSYKIDEFMILDITARRNLEITETLKDKKKRGSLLWVLDRTSTSVGGRELRKWLQEPLKKIEDIIERHEAVGEFKEKFMQRCEIREALAGIYDIERLTGKIVLGSANPRDLIALKNSIYKLKYIKEMMGSMDAELNIKQYEEIDLLSDIEELIEKSILDEPPIAVKEGGIIKEGYNSEVDELRSAGKEGRQWLTELEKREKKKTGITKLKVGFNRVFGYYIEVTKSFMNMVPDNYIRKQTLANCERYITEELKEMEDKILGSKERYIALEYELFIEIRDIIGKEIKRLLKTSKAIAVIDVLSTLAEVADRENYIRPDMTEGYEIDIRNGRHPVVEKMMGDDSFVPNDTLLDNEGNMILIITGPNMAGKSTYMRQVAIITLMAQAGSFIPADKAAIGITDRIFTRVGASDDLSGGDSTFMVEMKEVAEILNNATSRSLLILDEIGRGTSTYDGLSIAWAVTEYIASKEKIGARTLFATHYHELTELEGKINGLKNFRITAEKTGDDIIFLRKIEKGGADESYGIEVAKLAGVPQHAILRSKDILQKLEEADIGKKDIRKSRKKSPIEGQLEIMSFNKSQKDSEEIINKLKETDISKLTPMDAINLIHELQKKIMN
jgi:DNA mismatch repair protein MutS